MDLQVIARNVRRLRMARPLSQSALANSAGLSLPAIKGLEGAVKEPRMKTLQAIARALDVRIEDLFKPVRSLQTVRFRSAKRMQNRENILADVARWLDDFNYLEQVLDEKIPFLLPDFIDKDSRSDVVKVATQCRTGFNLRTDEPIHDICGLLEHGSIKVYPARYASEGFFGLSIGKEDGGPAIVVNVWDRIPVERRIFSAAHELGHLVLHQDSYDVNESRDDRQEEEEANLFAGHFLMPDEGFNKEWAETAGLHWVDRVFKVKRIFHVSYKTVLFRLIDHGADGKSIWKKFNLAYHQRFNRKLNFKEEPMENKSKEPFDLQEFDFYEDRLSRLTRLAVESDKISLSRGAEILRIGIEEMQERLRS